MAKGEYVALFDHDDTLAEDALLIMAEEIKNSPSLDLLFSDEDRLSKDGDRVSSRRHDRNRRNRCMFRSKIRCVCAGFRLHQVGSGRTCKWSW